MPLFFILSGVFFSWNLKSSDFLIKKFNTVLKPYALVSFALLGITALKSPEILGTQLIGILYGNGETIRCTPMWFLTHLFIVNVLHISSSRIPTCTALENQQEPPLPHACCYLAQF
jgi:fucose 4-O-acetylase-like acetyltransferase